MPTCMKAIFLSWRYILLITIVTLATAITSLKFPIWDHAWYATEVRREILRLGYNPDNCCTVSPDWRDFLNRSRIDDEEYVGAIEELCRRYCLPDDAERLEAKRIHQAKSGIPSAALLEYLMKEIVKQLAGCDPMREVILSHWYFRIPPSNVACYWKVYYCFSDHCVDIRFDERVKKYRSVFAMSCTAGWLNYEKTCGIMKSICRDFDLYQTHPRAHLRNDTLPRS